MIVFDLLCDACPSVSAMSRRRKSVNVKLSAIARVAPEAQALLCANMCPNCVVLNRVGGRQWREGGAASVLD